MPPVTVQYTAEELTFPNITPGGFAQVIANVPTESKIVGGPIPPVNASNPIPNQGWRVEAKLDGSGNAVTIKAWAVYV